MSSTEFDFAVPTFDERHQAWEIVGYWPEFDEARTCDKCGSARTDAAMRWPQQSSWLSLYEAPWQHIRRTCVRCGYVWRERCLDHAAQEPTQ